MLDFHPAPFQSIGISQASSFPRFGAIHDSAIFGRIDNDDWEDADDQKFLLGYRSLCRELYAKLTMSEAYLPSVANHGDPDLRAFVNRFLLGTDLGLSELIRTKKVADKRMLERDFQVESINVSLGRDLPLRIGGVFAPEYDYTGGVCFVLRDGTKPAYHISVCTHTSRHDVVGVFTWFIDCLEIDMFCKSFNVIRADHKRSAFAQTCFDHFEHIYFSPDWWNNLPSSMAEKIAARFVENVPGERPQNCLIRDATFDCV